MKNLIVLNDQGGAVMDVSYEKTATLRAQDHGHPPVICLNFQGSKSNNVVSEDGKAYSLNAMHGHDVHVVCFEPGIAKREGSDSRFVIDKTVTLRANMGDNQPAVCYAIDSHPMDSRFELDWNISPTVTAKLAKGSADGPLVIVKNE